MRTLHLTTSNFDSIFNQLNDQLDGNCTRNLKEYVFEFSNECGYGTIRGAKVKGRISFIEFNLTFNDDVKLIIESPVEKSVNFMYCAEGTLQHSFGDMSKSQKLEAFQTGIISNIRSHKNVLFIEKDNRLNSSLITVDCTANEKGKNVLTNQLKETFISNKNEDFIYVGSYNLKIAEKIQQLNAISQEGVVRTLLIEGLVHIILALELQQHKRDLQKKSQDTGSLTKREMKAIRELSEFINNYPETSLTVSELCAKAGLSSAKLQEGFKRMHNHTVNDYIREVRVKKSEELIKTTDLNISQIVYTVGFSSRSYFSKIFKQKYNCSPNEYKARNKMAISA
ncbi:MAG: helix-turn-helix transcriptional regulator [Flavobacteriaceae bacterium]|nr:helix-turn-helix transcriptional regulator [Flavobacteriaceae bacterium]